MLLNYVIWAVNREIVELGPLVLRWYGIFFALGFIISYILLGKMFRKEGISQDTQDTLTFYMVASTIIGARLGHCLFYEPDYYLSHPLEILKIWKGGLASHGATIGILTGLYIFSKRETNRSYYWVLDRITIMIPMAGACIRLGNLFNSEIVGKISTVPWAFQFPWYDGGFPAPPRHPSQLYEAFLYLILFFYLKHYYYKNVQHLKDGMIFSQFLIGLFSIRVLIEFLKENQVEFEQGMLLNMGQLLSIPLIIAGFIIYWKQKKSKPINYLKQHLK